MEDRDWDAEWDQETAVESARLEQRAQVPSDPRAFCIALMQALRYVPPPPVQVEAAVDAAA